MNSWGRRAALVGVLLTVTLTVAVVSWLGPWFRDDQVLDAVVRAVALDWRDFGEEAARRRLQYELDHERVGMQVGDDECAFEVASDGTRVVRCAWTVDATLPALDLVVPLAFESVARITPSGDLL